MPVGQNEQALTRRWIDDSMMAALLVLPPHANALEELLIMAETRQLLFS